MLGPAPDAGARRTFPIQPVILLPHFTSALLARSFFTWLVLRLVTMGGSMVIAQMHGIAEIASFATLSPAAVLALLVVVTGIGRVYMRRRGEDRFLLSLGFGRLPQISTLLAAPVTGELCILLSLPV